LLRSLPCPYNKLESLGNDLLVVRSTSGTTVTSNADILWACHTILPIWNSALEFSKHCHMVLWPSDSKNLCKHCREPIQCLLLEPEAMSQGLPCGSFCSCRDCKAAQALRTRIRNRLAIASSSEQAFVNLLRGCECLGV